MSLNESGVITMVIGMAVFAIGAVLVFDKALMIAGNFLIIGGFIMIAKSRIRDFLSFQKIQGTIIFCLGLFCLLMNFGLLGFMLELFGLIIVFKSFLPDFRSVIFGFLFGKTIKKS